MISLDLATPTHLATKRTSPPARFMVFEEYLSPHSVPYVSTWSPSASLLAAAVLPNACAQRVSRTQGVFRARGEAMKNHGSDASTMKTLSVAGKPAVGMGYSQTPKRTRTNPPLCCSDRDTFQRTLDRYPLYAGTHSDVVGKHSREFPIRSLNPQPGRNGTRGRMQTSCMG